MKHKHFKHLFTALLLLCTTVVTAHDFEVGGIYYNILSEEEKTVEVTYKGASNSEYSNEYTGSVIIPQSVTYNGTVYSVTSIGFEAFYGCSGLTSITIPNSVTSIGDCAFDDCTALTNIVIPSSVTSIGKWAFATCSAIESIVVDSENNVYDSRNNCNAIIETSTNKLVLGCKNTVVPNDVTAIGYAAFDGCTGLTQITIPNNVTSIGEYAFYGCTGLKTVYNYSNLTFTKGSSNYGYVAYYAKKLYNAPNGSVEGDYIFGKPNGANTLVGYLGNDTELTLPTDYKGKSYVIGSAAFYGNKTLSSVVIPNSVTSIEERAFYNCTGLTSVVIPNSVTSIGNYAFSGCYGLKEVHINDIAAWCNIDFESGDANPLYYAQNLYLNNELITELVIPNGVKSIKKYAFQGCSGLTSITIPNSVTSIGNYAFNWCSGLTSITIPNSVTSIGDNAFAWCSGLTSIAIPNSVTSIGERAFNGCTGLKTVVNLSDLTFTKGSSSYGYVAYYADKIINNGFIEGDFVFNRTNGVNTLVAYLGNATELTLPADYEGESYVIGESAFENNEYVASVTIPEGVEMICDKAFSGCSNLESIVMPNSMSAIGGDAFAGTKWYDNEEDDIVYAGNVLYKYKGSMPENTAITINDGTLGIAGLAFANCTGLTCIEIPASVTNIGNYAFDACTGLTSITSLIPAEYLFAIDSDVFSGVDKNACTLCVPYGAKETYAATAGWNVFVNIVELVPTDITVTINQYGNATYCSPLALDFSNVEGLKAYAATGYKSNSQVVTLTRVQTAKAGIGLFLKAEPGEYVVPVIESTDEHSLNLLVGTLEQTTVNSTSGEMSNYKFTIADGDAAPMFYPFEDNTTFSAGKAYLQIPTAWLPSTAQKSLSVRFDEGERTEIDEVEDENEDVKTVYDLQGRVVENPTSGIYIIDGKKVLIK